MGKKVKKLVLTILLGTVFCTSELTAQMAVFDASAFMNSLTQIYNMYDQINATIESVQNGYQQIKQATERVKSFGNFTAQSFSSWSSNDNVLAASWENIGIARERTRQANGYVSMKVDEANRIKKQFENSSLTFNGVDYTLKDLCGRGDAGQSIFGLAKDIGDYTMDCWEESARGWEEGLTYQEREKIWSYYGVSPETYYLEQCAEQFVNGFVDSSLQFTAPNYDTVNLENEEQNVQQILSLIEAADGSESEVAHLSVLRELQLKQYQQQCELGRGLARLLSYRASKEVQEQLERKIAAEEKAAKEAERKLEDLRMSSPYRHNGF